MEDLMLIRSSFMRRIISSAINKVIAKQKYGIKVNLDDIRAEWSDKEQKVKGRMDLLPWYGIMEVSKHCEEGALKYGEHNVDKGIPLHSLLDSASRHLAKYMVGMDDEDHLRAACWNLLWALNQRETHPELDDRFAVKVGEVKKKNYQVLCPNCEATIIKENGQICDGVAWRVCVPNEKIKLKCCYCNRAVIVSIKDIVDERLKGETDE